MNCDVDGCTRLVKSSGLCGAHYERRRRNARLDLATTTERFFAKVDKTETCWLWTGAFTHGYGRFQWPGRATTLAHRISYELLVGPIPEGLHLDHLCRNPPCVNPAHLEPVTPKVNVIRGVGWAGRNAGQEACSNGHPYDFVDTQGRRRCSICVKQNRVRENQRRLAARSALRTSHI